LKSKGEHKDVLHTLTCTVTWRVVGCWSAQTSASHTLR